MGNLQFEGSYIVVAIGYAHPSKSITIRSAGAFLYALPCTIVTKQSLSIWADLDTFPCRWISIISLRTAMITGASLIISKVSNGTSCHAQI